MINPMQMLPSLPDYLTSTVPAPQFGVPSELGGGARGLLCVERCILRGGGQLLRRVRCVRRRAGRDERRARDNRRTTTERRRRL